MTVTKGHPVKLSYGEKKGVEVSTLDLRGRFHKTPDKLSGPISIFPTPFFLLMGGN